MLAEESPDPAGLCALAYLLAPHAPERVPEIVKRLPPELRDDLSNEEKRLAEAVLAKGRDGLLYLRGQQEVGELLARGALSS